MSVLALESADGSCSIAWSDGAALELHGPVDMRDSLAWMIQQVEAVKAVRFPDWRGLQGIACCIGPGGFTGVRVAVGYAQGLGLATALPVIGISSLDALAQQVPQEESFWVALDARMGELYLAEYTRDADGVAVRIGDERLLAPEQAQALIRPAQSLWGPGFEAWPQHFGAQLRPGARLTASGVLERAVLTPVDQWPDAAQLQPVYLRNKVAQTVAERAEAKRQTD